MMNNDNRRRRTTQAGVTLIEMLVVVMIIGLFAGLVTFNMMKKAEAARRTAAKAQINAFMTALGSYKLDTGAYPSQEQGLNALRTRPENVNGWAGPYISQELPLDPWGHPYGYKYPGEHGDEPDIISLGADGQLGGANDDADIVSWKSK
jgi:general secretion pathway protein G